MADSEFTRVGPSSSPEFREAAQRFTLRVKGGGGGRRGVRRDVQPSKQPQHDEGNRLTSSGQLIEPPWKPDDLVVMREGSSVLGQCVDSYAVNIESHGHEYPLAISPQEAADLEDAIKLEIDTLDGFFDNVSWDQSFSDLRLALRQDLETLGYAAIEVLREEDGTLSGFQYVRAYKLRLSPVDKEPTRVHLWRMDTAKRQWKKKFFNVRLRRYGLLKGSGGHGTVTWFKEYGDPRSISSRTGKVIEAEAENELEGQTREKEEEAGELLFFRIHSPRTPYGIPRWIGCHFAMGTSGSAERQNFHHLEDNGIPPFMILTTAELDEITEEDLADEWDAFKGNENRWTPLVIQARAPAGDGDVAAGMIDQRQARSPVLQVVKFDRMTEGMFMALDKTGREKVQQAFRLPDIVLGKSEHTYATAVAALRMVEQQVFTPLRRPFDWVMNRRILPELGVVLHRFATRGPTITDHDAVSKLMTAAGPLGVGSPNDWGKVVGRALGQKIEAHPDTWGNLPLTLVSTLVEQGKLDVVEEEGRFTLVMAPPQAGEEQDDFVRSRQQIVELARQVGARLAIIGGPPAADEADEVAPLAAAG